MFSIHYRLIQNEFSNTLQPLVRILVGQDGHWSQLGRGFVINWQARIELRSHSVRIIVINKGCLIANDSKTRRPRRRTMANHADIRNEGGNQYISQATCSKPPASAQSVVRARAGGKLGAPLRSARRCSLACTRLRLHSARGTSTLARFGAARGGRGCGVGAGGPGTLSRTRRGRAAQGGGG